MERTKKITDVKETKEEIKVEENGAPFDEVVEAPVEETKEEIKVEVKETTTVDPKIRWKKVGGGSLRIFNRIIKPGEIFEARVDEIPKAFRDLIVPLSAIPENIPEISKKAFVEVYSMQPRGKSKSLFDIINSTGKVMNEKGLTKEVAEQLMQDLQR